DVVSARTFRKATRERRTWFDRGNPRAALKECKRRLSRAWSNLENVGAGSHAAPFGEDVEHPRRITGAGVVISGDALELSCQLRRAVEDHVFGVVVVHLGLLVRRGRET